MTGIALALADEEFAPPDVESAFFHDPVPSLQISSLKAMILIGIGVLLVILLMVGSARKASVVPSRFAFLGESIYGFVRNGIAIDVLGKEGRRYAPLLAAMFLFILINNLFGIIPFAQHAPTSQFAVPVFLAVLSYIVYNVEGIRKHGFGGYIKSQTVIPDVPAAMHLLLVPIEFLSNLILRPVTLAIRLFANMFAGHMLVLVATSGTLFLLQSGGTDTLLAILPGIGSIGLVFFELMIAALQAYVFVILTAVYISTSIADEH